LPKKLFDEVSKKRSIHHQISSELYCGLLEQIATLLKKLNIPT